MTDVIHLRQSDLARFVGCERSFYLGWQLRHAKLYDKSRPRECSNADVGTMVHGLMAAYYRGQLPERPTHMDMEDVATAAMAEAEVDWTLGSWIEGRSLATIMFRDYPRWVESEGHDLRYNVVGVEERLTWTVRVNGVQVEMSGQLDLRLQDEILGAYGIGDHKSMDGGKFKAPRPNNFQLLTYGVLARHSFPDLPIEFGFWNGVKRNKRTAKASPPFFNRWTLPFNPPMLDQHEDYLLRIAARIVRFLDKMETSKRPEIDATRNMTGECGWACNVEEICDVMDNPAYDWRDFANTNYPIRETPVELQGDDD